MAHREKGVSEKEAKQETEASRNRNFRRLPNVFAGDQSTVTQKLRQVTLRTLRLLWQHSPCRNAHASCGTKHGDHRMPAIQSAPSDLEFLTIENVAELLKLSTRGVRNLCDRGTFPKPIKLGRSTRWHADAVREWIAETIAKAGES